MKDCPECYSKPENAKCKVEIDVGNTSCPCILCANYCEVSEPTVELENVNNLFVILCDELIYYANSNVQDLSNNVNVNYFYFRTLYAHKVLFVSCVR